ncbi:hypothetical protein [Cellulosimicrobium cellulans]|uniref:hypothetical protein n=1 Tax=Cellulosimicrobium cellulans TaxID=1710 RepID=UPI001BA4B673|nr:hypothetical protein [Cellulosimicrobium cellulans]QUC00769.1 hypothetical protein J5A69_06015 [Cellulosimicrobium cellulans]
MKYFRRIVIALLAVLALTFSAAPANASASWAGTLNAHDFKFGSSTYSVPTGAMAHSISGKGRSYTKWYADAVSTRLCYGRLDLLQKSGSTVISRYAGSNTSGCVGALTRTRTNGTFAANATQACAEYRVHVLNKVIKQQCHWVTS